MRYLQAIFGGTPQTAPLLGAGQAANSAGGYAWAVDKWKRLERFLILGSEGGTYYIDEQKLTVENAKAALECLEEDGARVVKTVVEISEAGRAPRQGPALFVLALAAGRKFADTKTNAAALAALPKVARTATHLCEFAALVDGVRGWGRGLRSAVAGWYVEKPVPELAYQMLKYRRRTGWSHRDLLRKSHPKAAAPARNALFRWAAEGDAVRIPAEAAAGDLRQVQAFERARQATEKREVVRLIEDYRLTHEMIPAKWRSSPEVWEALLEFMPYAAMVRNLGKLTAVGLVAPQSAATALVLARLIDRRRIAASRVHPVALLSALLAYKRGKGPRGRLRWAPVSHVVDALDQAFYASFDNVESTGRHVYVGLDASGSMQQSMCNGMPYLSAAMASAALAMVFARTEPRHTLAAFHERIWHVDLSARDRLDRACEAIVRQPSATDASLPFQDALDRRLEVDAFILLTDSETWAGEQHPVQALARYRRQMGIPARLVVVAMAANRFSIADPNDAGQMDVAGFDASVPRLLADFIRD